mmetsp:Transcript_25387/g.68721  ORF Transcript_25387/g.68721 Transcript_25387/m.68721 type:complete len:202 (+) Transcript_25387:171-776(+)
MPPARAAQPAMKLADDGNHRIAISIGGIGACPVRRGCARGGVAMAHMCAVERGRGRGATCEGPDRSPHPWGVDCGSGGVEKYHNHVPVHAMRAPAQSYLLGTLLLGMAHLGADLCRRSPHVRIQCLVRAGVHTLVERVAWRGRSGEHGTGGFVDVGGDDAQDDGGRPLWDHTGGQVAYHRHHACLALVAPIAAVERVIAHD